MNTDNKVEVDQNELPTFTIKTRLDSASMDNRLHEPMDVTDDEQDDLDPSPSKASFGRQYHGAKRKAEHDSPTPHLLSRSSSYKMVPEVLIMVPSPKKKRLA
jgi:hypothetical protein